MAVAGDALTERFDVAVLLSHQGAPGQFHPRLVPAVDRPLRRLGAVVVLQRLALQTIAWIARQIAGGLVAWHVISPIRRLWMRLRSTRRDVLITGLLLLIYLDAGFAQRPSSLGANGQRREHDE